MPRAVGTIWRKGYIAPPSALFQIANFRGISGGIFWVFFALQRGPLFGIKRVVPRLDIMQRGAMIFLDIGSKAFLHVAVLPTGLGVQVLGFLPESGGLGFQIRDLIPPFNVKIATARLLKV